MNADRDKKQKKMNTDREKNEKGNANKKSKLFPQVLEIKRTESTNSPLNVIVVKGTKL